MAIERKRGCGFRKVGGYYLVGGYISVPCDRMPHPIGSCPVCGQGIHFTRAFTEISPLKLFGVHQPCDDAVLPCFLCTPTTEPAFIMWVGTKHYPTPEPFLTEATEMGISKRVHFIPKKLELGKTVIYLAHPKAIQVREPLAVQQAMSIVENYTSRQPALFPTELANQPTYHMGIFAAFIPKRIEKLVWESELTDPETGAKMREDLEKRGITPVSVPDGDRDHAV